MTLEDTARYDSISRQLTCTGDWNLSNLPHLQDQLEKISWPTSGTIKIDGAAIRTMDSAGAWQFIQVGNKLKQTGVNVEFIAFAKDHETLLKIISQTISAESILPVEKKPNTLAVIGKSTVNRWHELQIYLAFIGHLTFETLRLLPRPAHWRWKSFFVILDKTGYQALPIIALLSFLIGVVLTYQMGLQLRNYGANIYIVDLLGLSVVREFSPLITAIMVSGRTGSAFTASIGMMKLNQEIDALNTLGVTPAELLLLPRIFGLLISLPLLTMWSDIFGVFGGMVMSNNMLGISWYDFLHRFPTVIPLRSFIIGIGKAPVFALIIASIGCYQGMQVKNSAESVGQNTTRSVVLSIFFIIVADAIFSILFSKMKL